MAKVVRFKYLLILRGCMVKLSEKTIQLLKDDIISILYENPLKARFTNEIAVELRRNNEFTKKLLFELKKGGLVEEVSKNNKGQDYLRNKRWRIPPKVLEAFSQNEKVLR